MAEGINKKLKDVEEKLDALIETGVAGKKPKEFKIPTMAKLNKRRLKDNWVTVVKINENGNIDFKKEPIIDQTIDIDGVPRLATGEYVLNYKGKPMIIQPSWSVKPFSPAESYQKSLSDGSNIVGYSLLLARMKMGAIGLKKKLSGGMIIGGIIALVVVGYLLFGGG